MNTKLTYLYRDAGNWKQFNTVILRGLVSKEDQELIASRLEEGIYFLPKQVGLEPLQRQWETLNDLDHIWHELDLESLALTEEKPTVKMTASQLVGNFQRVTQWNETSAYNRLFGNHL